MVNKTIGLSTSKNGETLELAVESIEQFSSLASRYIREGKYDLAVEQCQILVKMAPDDWKSHYTLAFCLNKTGDFKPAKLPAAIAAEKAPEEYAVQLLYAELCSKDGDWASYEKVSRVLSLLDDNNPATQRTLGLIAEHKGDLLSAEVHFRKVVEYDPTNIANVLKMGAFYRCYDKVGKALELFADTLERSPQSHQIWNNMGNCFLALKQHENARDCYLQALSFSPESIMYFLNLGHVHHALGDNEKALEIYRQVLINHPDCADAHYNMSLSMLTLGSFEQGWTEYEWRWRTSGFSRYNRDFGGLLLWDHVQRQGTRILIWQEQGMGDAIQFIRYIPYLQKSGLSVTVFCDESLRRLFHTIDGVERIITSETEITDCDCTLPMHSLPFALRSYQMTADVQYITINEELVQSHKRFINRNRKIKVGLVWGGNPKYPFDKYRSFHIDSARALFDLQNIEFYSLQKGEYGIELQNSDLPIIDLGPYISDFLDTAAIMKNLNLVISVDTAPLHLAGAIGVPVWGLIPRFADWRWMQNRTDTPWYPSMKLYRNNVEGEWGDVFERVRVDLMTFHELR